MIDLFEQDSEDLDPEARQGDANLSQWFTPFWVAEELVEDALSGMGNDVSVVEPSCGTGAFLTAIPEHLPAMGVDIDPLVMAAARKNSGREIILGDFRTVSLPRDYQVAIGNPPFEMEVINGFLDRAYRDLPDDGLIAMVLPAYAFQTPRQVTRWMDMYSIDVKVIPRNIFPGLSKPLVWAKYVKTPNRVFSGMMLFSEARDIEQMRPAIKEALVRPGTWRSAVALALKSLGGEASVRSIYDAIAPERRSSEHWRPKIRQTLQRGFISLGEGRWALPQTA